MWKCYHCIWFHIRNFLEGLDDLYIPFVRTNLSVVVLFTVEDCFLTHELVLGFQPRDPRKWAWMELCSIFVLFRLPVNKILLTFPFHVCEFRQGWSQLLWSKVRCSCKYFSHLELAQLKVRFALCAVPSFCHPGRCKRPGEKLNRWTHLAVNSVSNAHLPYSWSDPRQVCRFLKYVIWMYIRWQMENFHMFYIGYYELYASFEKNFFLITCHWCNKLWIILNNYAIVHIRDRNFPGF